MRALSAVQTRAATVSLRGPGAPVLSRLLEQVVRATTREAV